MKLVEGNRDEIMKKLKKSVSISRLLLEFSKSEMQCVKLQGAKQHYKNADSAKMSLRQRIKSHALDISVVSDENGEIYLVKA